MYFTLLVVVILTAIALVAVALGLEHQKTEYPDTHIHESNPVAFGPAAVPWLCLCHPIFLLSFKRPGKGCPGRLPISFMFDSGAF